MDCGRPKTGAVADCMRRTRAAYHHAIRKVKLDEGKMINERLADSIIITTQVISGPRLSVFARIKAVLVA
jgi:hypothetical protein